MILATDMAKHGMLMKRIKEKLAQDDYNPLETNEGVNLLLQIALKCADISNQARPWKVANRKKQCTDDTWDFQTRHKKTVSQ